MPLSATMRQNLQTLLSDWPKPGERVKIARFSSNTKGQYTELMYDATLDAEPSEAYLYHLRDEDNRQLLACLRERNDTIKQSFTSALSQGLSIINTRLPKTEIFYSLKRLSETVLANDEIEDKTVLIISDGMENSETISFYKKRRKGIAALNGEQIIAKLEEHNLFADWQGAKIHMFGLANMSDTNKHIKASQLEMIRGVWEAYFLSGNGVIKSLGTPAVLASSLRKIN